MLSAAFGLLKDSGRVLFEIAPEGLNVDETGDAIAGHPGVTEVHGLHVWEIGSGFPSLSARVLVRPSDDCHAIRREVARTLDERFGIEHTTLHVDHRDTSPLLQLGPPPSSKRPGTRPTAAERTRKLGQSRAGIRPGFPGLG